MICMDGFVMDTYCAARGILLDTGGPTLEEPETHTLGCLLKPICASSGFELLEDATTDGKHCRAYKFDSRGEELVEAVARPVLDQGLLVSGFRATVIGQPTGSSSPQRLEVSNLLFNTSCAVAAPGVPVATPAMTAEHHKCSTLEPFYKAHGSLMLLSWGFLLPAGVIVAKFLRHKDPLWYRVHRTLQPVGLLVAIAGWILALATFGHYVFDSHALTGMTTHGILGSIVMILGIQQPLNAVLRPHKERGEERSMIRKVWELLHKGSGYVAVLLGIVQIAGGIVLLPYPSTGFAAGLGVSLGLLLVLIVALFASGRQAAKAPKFEAGDGIEGGRAGAGGTA